MRREDAASESIGTILILAITITGIGIVAALLLGNVTTDEIPQLDIAIVNETNEQGVSIQQLTLQHTSGDTIKPGEMQILVNGNDETENAYLSEDSPPWVTGSTPFGLGKTLNVYTREIPESLTLVYKKGSETALLVQSSSFTTRQRFPTGGETRPPDWQDDTTAPHISDVRIVPAASSYNVGAEVSITWTASDNVQLKGAMIEYFNGGSWETVISLTSATKPYTWTIPDNIGTGRLVRVTVSDISGNSASDESDPFAIIDDAPPTVTVTKPSGGESYKTGEVMAISWTATDNRGISGISIWAVIPGTSGERLVSIASGVGNTGSYSWTIPIDDTLRSAAATIRIDATDTNGNIGTGTSEPFTIGESSAPVVVITTPVSGTSWEAGTSQQITWTATDNIGVTGIDIAYSVSGGAWTTIGEGLANTGSYNWNVPNAASNSVRIRITAHDEDGNAGTATSDLFTITVSTTETITLFLYYPDGGETLTPGDTFSIQWTASAPSGITGIDLAYTTDNGATWLGIASGETNDGTYSWVVPTSPTTQARVRVTAHSTSGLVTSVMSTGTFTIGNPELTVTVHSPNGGEIWNIGSVYPITWTAEDPDGSTGISSIAIEYTANNGGTWTQVASGIANTGSYDWTTPTTETTQGRIRVTATGTYGNTKSDMSNALFTIKNTPPVVTVTSPNGGEAWTVGSQHLINWTATDSDGISSVVISYSANRGISYTQIATVSNTGSYIWAVPDSVTTEAVVRITATDTAGKTATDYSNAVFTIAAAPPLITVTSPNGGESYMVGSTTIITWSVTDPGSITSIDIAYSINDSTTTTSIVTGLLGTATSYSWTIPDSQSTRVKVIVTAHTSSGGVQSDKSNGYFTITSPAGETITLFLFYPDGGETITPGSTFTIRWSASAPSGITGIDLAFSADNGGTWTSIVTGTTNTGTYAWTVPSQATTQGRVRVTAYSIAGATASTMSTSSFTISDPSASVVLSSPNGGEVWNMGSAYLITWTASDPEGISSITLTFSADNGATWTNIAAGIANSGSYSWTTPNTETTLGRVRVTAYDINNNPTSDSSDTPFTIQNLAPEVLVTSPNGGESWSAGSVQPITWTASDADGIQSIVISYSANQGTSWTDIGTVSNTGSYSWTVPSVATSNAIVRITATDTKGKSKTDYSDAVFTIVLPTPAVTVTSPNGGQNYATGSTQTISWTTTNPGFISTIDIAYSINDSSIHTSIVTGLAGTATSYSWTVPGSPSTRVKIIVTAHTSSGSSVSDASDAFFTISDTISPTITIIEPNGGESWQGNPSTNPQRIEWTASDNIAVTRIKLEYSTNSGSSWKDIIDYLSNNGYYYWYVPKDYSTTCKVRGTAYDESGNSASAISNGLFTIRT